MDDPNSPANLAQTIAFELQNPVDTGPRRRRLFQVIDSLVWAYVQLNVDFDASQFDVDPEFRDFTNQVCTGFRYLTAEGVHAVCRLLAPLRPAGDPLPMLTPGQFNPALQGERTYEANKRVKDQAYRGLVNDLEMARYVMQKYEAGSDDVVESVMLLAGLQTGEPGIQARLGAEVELIRSNLAEQRGYVQELFAAMVDFTDIVDRPRKVGRLSQQAGQNPADPVYRDNRNVRRLKETPNVVLEALCWFLLDAILEAQRGNILTSQFQMLLKKELFEYYENFRKRFDTVLGALKSSKALPCNMMETDMIRRLAASPSANIKRKFANDRTNNRRRVEIATGKAHLAVLQNATGQEAEENAEEDGEDEEEDEEIDGGNAPVLGGPVDEEMR